jgi:hypothetical protein
MNYDIMCKSWTINDNVDDDDVYSDDYDELIHLRNIIITWFIISGIGPTRNSTVTINIHINIYIQTVIPIAYIFIIKLINYFQTTLKNFELRMYHGNSHRFQFFITESRIYR